MKTILVVCSVLMLGGCSVGKGWLLEPTGIQKCVNVEVEAGNMTIDTLSGPTIEVTGQGIKWSSESDEYCPR